MDAEILLGIAVSSPRPDGRKELPVRHRLPGMSHQESQQLPLDGRQVNRAENKNAFLRYVTPGYLATLGLKPGATLEQVQAAYRAAASRIA